MGILEYILNSLIWPSAYATFPSLTSLNLFRLLSVPSTLQTLFYLSSFQHGVHPICTLNSNSLISFHLNTRFLLETFPAQNRLSPLYVFLQLSVFHCDPNHICNICTMFIFPCGLGLCFSYTAVFPVTSTGADSRHSTVKIT